jgi:hypothetical protein
MKQLDMRREAAERADAAAAAAAEREARERQEQRTHNRHMAGLVVGAVGSRRHAGRRRIRRERGLVACHSSVRAQPPCSGQYLRAAAQRPDDMKFVSNATRTSTNSASNAATRALTGPWPRSSPQLRAESTPRWPSIAEQSGHGRLSLSVTVRGCWRVRRGGFAARAVCVHAGWLRASLGGHEPLPERREAARMGRGRAGVRRWPRLPPSHVRRSGHDDRRRGNVQRGITQPGVQVPAASWPTAVAARWARRVASAGWGLSRCQRSECG